MQIAGPSLWIAPLATGHPHGLPGAKRSEKQSTKVQPLDQSHDTDAALARHQAPENFWKAVNGEPVPEDHVAPPTIMQLKISQMLDEQAQEMETSPLSSNTKEESPIPVVSTEVTQTQPNEIDEQVQSPDQSPLPAPKPPLRAYDEAASMSRSSVFSTLP